MHKIELDQFTHFVITENFDESDGEFTFNLYFNQLDLNCIQLNALTLDEAKKEAIDIIYEEAYDKITQMKDILNNIEKYWEVEVQQ